jgi:threonine dehydrogenase-like Zn-dependent dehydrogenase
MTTSRRVVLTAERRLEADVVTLPEPGPEDLLMRVVLCGICATDVHFFQGHLGVRYPLVLGHEFVGEVAAIGPEATARRGLQPGDRIAVEMLLPCGLCPRCREGRSNLCDEDDPFEEGLVGREYGCNMDGDRPPGLWGGYAQHLHVPREAVVHRLPPSLAWESAVLVEPLAVAFHAVGRARVRPGDRVVVVGSGPIGLMLVLAARSAGAARVVVTGLEPERLALAERLGADAVLDVRDADAAALVRAALGGELADVCLEAAGTPAAQEQAVTLVRRGGRVALVGACGPARVSFEPDTQLLLRELDLLPSFLSSGGYEPAIALLAREAWPVGDLVAGYVGLDDLPGLFDALAGGRRSSAAVKTVVDPWQVAA